MEVVASGVQGVIRYIPYGARSDVCLFVSLLQDLLVSAHSARRALDIRKLLSMAKIILAPLPRSGRKHCSDSAAIFKERIALWRYRKWQALKEMYIKAYDRQQRRFLRDNDDNELTAGDLAEFLPDHLAHAVVKAVDDGAISKATKMLLSHEIDGSIDVLQALRKLHPPEAVPDLPTAEAVNMNFSEKEIARAITKFPPGRVRAHQICARTISSNVSVCRFCPLLQLYHRLWRLDSLLKTAECFCVLPDFSLWVRRTRKSALSQWGMFCAG